MRNSNQYSIIGVDEVGRGPIAGPVAVASFCVYSSDFDIRVFFPYGVIKDSKKLSSKNREDIYRKINEYKDKGELSFFVSFSTVFDIDNLGIVEAIKKALSLSLSKFNLDPDRSIILLDGSLKAPDKYIKQKTIIRGDETESLIALASIVAKVTRDKLMTDLSLIYPQYKFEKHKGYGTREHYQAIKKFGLCPEHRKSFLKNL